MAKAMNIMDVFRILLDGGHIVRKSPAVQGRSEYKVMTVSDDGQPDHCFGHITEKQFEELRHAGILDYADRTRTDKYGNLYTWFCLAAKGRD